ncbi:SDR family NAD(P)-dependent oxidoreductase [Nocardia beijingensis]|uniref:SDR family NAD(P)-dependent oxidoreductase n=1 Tax=Nocardia beijingensis TaxID=95162 RepID=UPI0033F8CD2E
MACGLLSSSCWQRCRRAHGEGWKRAMKVDFQPAARSAPWRRALVTGASAGIGQALVRELAARGVDLVIVARDEARLRRLADELSERHGVKVEVLAADLSDPQSRVNVEERLRTGSFIDLLVNNAGVGTFGAFATAEIDAELVQFDVNVVAPIRLTHAALCQMRRHGAGTVLTISSLDALLPVPYHAAYAATKSFVNSFFEGLSGELDDSPIVTTTVMPGYVQTEFTDRAGLVDPLRRVPKMLVLAPEQVARESLDAAAARKALYSPGRIYRLYAAVIGHLPRTVRARIAARIVPPDVRA